MAYVADRSRVVIVWSCYGWRVVIESQATIESDTENSHRVCHGQVDISDWYRRQRRIYSILGVHWWCTMEIDALTARVFIPFIKFRICITSFFDHPFHKRSVAFCGRRTTALADAFITRTKWTCRRREDNTRNLDATGRSKDAADSAHRVARDQSTWKPFLRLAKRERERAGTLPPGPGFICRRGRIAAEKETSGHRGSVPPPPTARLGCRQIKASRCN